MQGILGNIIGIFFLILSIIWLRFSVDSPLAFQFHFLPALSPSFSGNCTVFPSGYNHLYPAHQTPGFSFDPKKTSAATLDPRNVADVLGMHIPGLPHQYDYFNEYGQLLKDPAVQCQQRHGFVYLMRKREVWTWPAVEVGDRLQVESFQWTGNFVLHNVTTLHARPRVFEVDNFLAQDEIDTLKELADEAGYKKTQGEGERATLSEWSKILSRIDLRIADVLRIPSLVIQYHAHLDVIKYGEGEGSSPFHPFVEKEGEEGEYQHHLVLKRNILVSIIMQLEEPKAGGATCFPLANEDTPSNDPKPCDDSDFQVRLKKGSALVVYNLKSVDNMTGEKDPWAVRQDRVVTEGQRLIAVRDIYNKAEPPRAIYVKNMGHVYGYSYNYPVLPGDE